MFVPISNNSQGGYQIAKSLRLRSNANTYLNRIFDSNPDSETTFTYSLWVKRGALDGTGQVLLGGATGTTAITALRFDTDDTLHFWLRNSSTTTTGLVSSLAKFRDPAAWYHIVMVWDSTNPVATDRVRFYKNGERLDVTFSTSISLGQVPNGDFFTDMRIGSFRTTADSGYLDGYVAEVNMVDGLALDASHFGKFDKTTGAWVPKRYTGAYGTNGFYLDFKDGTSLSALGKDASGRGNDWTMNGFSLTEGVTYDWMDDTPTNNFCTLSPIHVAGSTKGTISNANLTWFGFGSQGEGYVGATQVAETGKVYLEFHRTTGSPFVAFGFTDAYTSQRNGEGLNPYDLNSGGFIVANTSGAVSTCKINDVSSSLEGVSIAYDEVAAFALDTDTGQLWVGKASGGVTTWSGGADPSTGTGEVGIITSAPNGYMPFVSAWSATSGRNGGATLNCGQSPFAGAVPAGFRTLCTKNLPAPQVKDPKKYFEAKTRTGTGVAGSVTGLKFAPDLVWLKSRSAATGNALYDTVRGPLNYLGAETVSAELTAAGTVTSFNDDGFSFGTQAGTNVNAASYIDWMWKRGAVPGFDIIPFTGTGANRTLAHGLGVAPSLVIVKSRSTAAGWVVWHSALTGSEYLVLNTSAAKATLATVWNSTPPDSSNIHLGTVSSVNANGVDYIAYAWADVPGFSKFGPYTGNGNADGPFVWTGFRPRWVLIKRIDADSSSHWILWDTARSPENVADDWLLASENNAEQSGATVSLDILSNGFKLRNTSANQNANGGTYIYAAFAECPFKYANAR